FGGYDVFPILADDDFWDNLAKFANESNQSIRYASSSFTLQKGVAKPATFRGKKYDLRLYMLITTFKKITKGYLFNKCLLRMSSQVYKESDISRTNQLTN